MSEGLNRVTLVGNLGSDPELRFTQNGQAILNLRMATTETYFDSNKEKKQKTEWHTVVVWGKRAESLDSLLKKGDRLLVEGGLSTRKYTAKDGTDRYATDIQARNVLLLGDKPAGAKKRAEPGESESGDNGFPTDDIPF